MRYNPAEKQEGTGGGRAQPGAYAFSIENAEEILFRSGNEGCKLTLQVAAFPDRDIKCFDNLVYSPNALWRVENLLTALGFDFNQPPPVEKLIGKVGRANFILDKESGYLRVKDYIGPSANNGPDTRSAAPSAPMPTRQSPQQPRTPQRPASSPAPAQRPPPRGRQPGEEEPPPFDDVPF